MIKNWLHLFFKVKFCTLYEKNIRTRAASRLKRERIRLPLQDYLGRGGALESHLIFNNLANVMDNIHNTLENHPLHFPIKCTL